MASLLPVWVAVPLAVVSAVGSVLGIVMTILNIDLAWHRLRVGAAKAKARLTR